MHSNVQVAKGQIRGYRVYSVEALHTRYRHSHVITTFGLVHVITKSVLASITLSGFSQPDGRPPLISRTDRTFKVHTLAHARTHKFHNLVHRLWQQMSPSDHVVKRDTRRPRPSLFFLSIFISLVPFQSLDKCQQIRVSLWPLTSSESLHKLAKEIASLTVLHCTFLLYSVGLRRWRHLEWRHQFFFCSPFYLALFSILF